VELNRKNKSKTLTENCQTTGVKNIGKIKRKPNIGYLRIFNHILARFPEKLKSFVFYSTEQKKTSNFIYLKI